MSLNILDLSEARARIDLEKKLRQELKPKASAWNAGRVDRLTYDWAFKILSSNQELGLDQERIVGRSRQLAANDPTMAKFLDCVWKNVFGPDGIKLQSKVLLQRGGKPNQKINPIIEKGWLEWNKKDNCSLDRRLSWIQLQRLLARVVPTDGECFLHVVEGANNPFGFALEIIDSDRVDRSWGRNTPLLLPNGNLVFMGIESSGRTGEPVAYHIFDRHPSEVGQGPRQRIRVPANEIIHIYLPIRDNQWRGIPWGLASMYRMNMLGGFMEAELVASRVAACQMGFVEKEADPNAVYSGEGEAGEIGSTGGQDVSVEAGMFHRLAPGESISQFKPEHPSTAFPSFVKESKLDIAAGLGVAYMTLSGDVGSANYSSARVGLLDERDTWEGLQGFFIESLMQPVFTRWLRSAFLTYPGLSSLATNYRDLDKAEWHPRAFPWVDPLKDAQAAILELNAGLTTRHRLLAAKGLGYEEVIEELKEEEPDTKELGLKVDTKGVVDAGVQPDATTPQGPDSGMPKGLLTHFVNSAHKLR